MERVENEITVTVEVISTEGHSVWQHKVGPTSRAGHAAGVCREFSERGGAQGLKLGSYNKDQTHCSEGSAEVKQRVGKAYRVTMYKSTCRKYPENYLCIAE